MPAGFYIYRITEQNVAVTNFQKAHDLHFGHKLAYTCVMKLFIATNKIRTVLWEKSVLEDMRNVLQHSEDQGLQCFATQIHTEQ